MKRALPFLSMAALTQVLLALNQLVLLPLQLRVWGSDTTAQWNVALAAAALILAADLGLRTTGHSALLRFGADRGDHAARAEFDLSWTGIRVLLAAAGLVLLVTATIWQPAGAGGGPIAWPALLVLAVWLEALMIARIMYLDTVGRYVQAEVAYTAMLVCRLVAATFALLVLKAGPVGLAWIHVGAALAGVAIQGRSCRDLPELALLAPLRLRHLGRLAGIVRYAAAEPLSLWLRVNLPVLVLATMAAPVVVTTYVVLRAIFGLVRNFVGQVARYTSVEDALARPTPAGAPARHGPVVAMALVTVLATAAGMVVIADHLRIAGLLLPGLDADHYLFVGVCFALPTCFVGYQLVQARLMRAGRTPAIARCQYAYAAMALAAGVVGWLGASMTVYLPLAAAAETGLALLFLRLDRAGLRTDALTLAVCGGALVAVVAALVAAPVAIFVGHDGGDYLASVVAPVVAMLAVAGGVTALHLRRDLEPSLDFMPTAPLDIVEPR